MVQRRRITLRIAIFALIAAGPGISPAQMGENPAITDDSSHCATHNPAGAIAGIRPVSGGRLTISQLRHEIIPLDDVLAELKPQQCGALVGVRLMQLRGIKIYRLRILMDSGGVVDLYVNARTGIPL
jgi:hypothetical protein